MKRLLIVMVLLGCVGLHANQKKQPSADMRAAKTIFIGWVDIDLNDWLPLGYANKQAWSDVIDWHNQSFQRAIQAWLRGAHITGAKNRSDENAAGQDLHVRFSNVRFDVKTYSLFVSIHFIDPKSGLELASLPSERYREGHFSVDNCLQGALKKVTEKLSKRIAARPNK